MNNPQRRRLAAELEQTKVQWAEEQQRAKAEGRTPDPRKSPAAVECWVKMFPVNHDALILTGVMVLGVLAAGVALAVVSTR